MPRPDNRRPLIQCCFCHCHYYNNELLERHQLMCPGREFPERFCPYCTQYIESQEVMARHQRECGLEARNQNPSRTQRAFPAHHYCSYGCRLYFPRKELQDDHEAECPLQNLQFPRPVEDGMIHCYCNIVVPVIHWHIHRCRFKRF